MNRIKMLRNELHLTQDELAKKLNCSKPSIAMYESGKRRPSLDILMGMSLIFDCSIEYILGTSDSQYTDTLQMSNVPIIRTYFSR